MTSTQRPGGSGGPTSPSHPSRFSSWRVTQYFREPGRATPILLSLGLALVITSQVLVQFRINLWQADFFNAIERRSATAIVTQSGIFAMLAAASTAFAVAQLSLTMRLQLGWRHWLSSRMVDRWLAYARHYQLGFIAGDHANPDQRIADDARIACEAIVDLGAGAFNALLMLACFIGVLWNLSGTVMVPVGGGIHIAGYMVWAALLYAAIGTSLTTLVGRPLARLSAAKLAAEGMYRADLVRTNENAEGIALMGGERDERHTLSRLFDSLAERWVALRRGTCNVAWLTTGFSLTGLIFPALVAAPLYLAGEMTLGGLMQAVSAMVHVQTALSWAVTNFARIADLRASAARITALVDILDAIDADRIDPHAECIVTRTGEQDALRILGLDIAHPDGTIVLTAATETINPGEKVLVIGESGAGKSTLLRAIAGVWPWGRGTIEWPRDGQMMFLPQRPYFPPATLAAALAYPLEPDAFTDDGYRGVLERCGLGALTSRLGETGRWDHVLSGADQQRLAFARVLLHRPRWVFLDEATSALDEDAQAELMRLLCEELAGTAVVSTGDRPGLEKLHDRTMTLVTGKEPTRLVRGLRTGHAIRTRDAIAATSTEPRTPRILARLRRLLADK